MAWTQYTFPGRFPIEKVGDIPQYSTRWHYLFEPGLLVRVESDNVEIPKGAIEGDSSKPITDTSGTVRGFIGDQDFYGGDELWQANADFLHSNSELVKVLDRQKKNSFKMQRKLLHLLCNQFGMNYWQEAILHLRCFFRSVILGVKYGRN